MVTNKVKTYALGALYLRFRMLLRRLDIVKPLKRFWMVAN